MAKSKDLKLKGRSGAKQRRKGRERCCENGGWIESTEDGQLSLYQPNRDLREPQSCLRSVGDPNHVYVAEQSVSASR